MTEQMATVPDRPKIPETEPDAKMAEAGQPPVVGKRSLSRKLMTAVLVLGFAAIAVLDWIAVSTSSTALLDQQSSSLEALRVSRAHFVEGYFSQVRNHLANFAGRRSVIETTEDFTAAFRSLPSQDRRPTDEGSEVYRAVVDYYVDEFRPRAEGAGFEWQRREHYLPMSATGRLLQATYVAGNPHPVGAKEELMLAGLDTDYDRAHAEVHPLAHNFRESFGYHDIFLFDLQGNLVYSVAKEADFATNFVGGPYQDSNMAALYHQLRGSAQRGEILFADFAPYEPSYGVPAAFIGTPVFRGEEKIGVTIFQLPVDEVNRIMTETAGLGETGETYLVGPDGLMRSASRFQDVSSILSVRVDTEAATLALAGESGTIVQPDYRGEEALSSYGPLDIQGLPWAIIAEFDMVEVVAATGPVLEVDESLLEEGIELDRYRLVEKLGEGGMGEVWLARHHMLARPAAVKLVRSEVFSSGAESEAAVQRFQREAKTIANLQSPNTVELFDFGVSEYGAFYYVMELLNGLDLNSMVEKFGPMPAERVVMLLKQACRSLTEAHAAGLVHRDIKPANLFVCKLGPECDFLKVLHFGIVKSVADAEKTAMTALTQAGQFTGTPAYTAPEQALEGGNVGPPTDLYALGCVAFWMLTGRTVFEADSPMQVLVQHTQSEPVAPSRMTEQPVPEALDAVILACLRKSPAERPQTADELWRMLGEVAFANPWSQRRAEEWWALHGLEMPGPERSAPTNSAG